MNTKTFELSLTQLETAFSKSKNNKYADQRKKTHFEQMLNVFVQIKKADYQSFSISEIIIHNSIFNYLLKGLEFLDDSTLNATPYEIVTCLERALEDWIKNDSFIIVTSLSNKHLAFSMETLGSEQSGQIKKIIYDKYGVQLDYRLIKINLPKLLVRDYLSCVVLYHELGHFVDYELNITSRAFFRKYNRFDPKDNAEYQEQKHFREFFADLFAAQYISDASNMYLSHIAYNAPDSITHPATKRRVDIVNDFIAGTTNKEIEDIQMALKDAGIDQLKIRYKIKEPSLSKFCNLIPETFENDDELHAIFKLGWDLWNESDRNFLMRFELRQRYDVVNNLIEKSISNHNIVEKWNTIKLE